VTRVSVEEPVRLSRCRVDVTVASTDDERVPLEDAMRLTLIEQLKKLPSTGDRPVS